MLDREEQLEWLEQLADLPREELVQIQRIMSRLDNGIKASFPRCPGDLYQAGTDKFTAEQLLDAWSDDVEPTNYNPMSSGEFWVDEASHPYDPSWDTKDGWIIIDEVKTGTTLTVEHFKQAQQALLKANVPMVSWSVADDYAEWINFGTLEIKTMSNYNTLNIPSISSFDCCETKCASVPVPCKAQRIYNKETTPMYTETQMKANYLSGEVENLYYNFDADLHNKFNQHNVQPKTAKQAREWLAAGGFVINGEDDARYFSSVWSDPSKPRDDAGFKVAQAALSKSFTDTIRTIKIADPMAGLEALKAFETANLIAN